MKKTLAQWILESPEDRSLKIQASPHKSSFVIGILSFDLDGKPHVVNFHSYDELAGDIDKAITSAEYFLNPPPTVINLDDKE